MITFNYIQAKEILKAFVSVESGFEFHVFPNVNGADFDISVYSLQELSSVLIFTVSKRCFHLLQGYGFTFDYLSI